VETLAAIGETRNGRLGREDRIVPANRVP
jgi:hypothetical protein